MAYCNITNNTITYTNTNTNTNTDTNSNTNTNTMARMHPLHYRRRTALLDRNLELASLCHTLGPNKERGLESTNTNTNTNTNTHSRSKQGKRT